MRFSAEDLEQHSASVVDSSVFLASRAGRVHSLSRADGSQRWVYENDGIEEQRPIVSGNVVVVTTG